MKILLLSPTGSHSTQRLVQEARRLKLNFTAASVADLNFVSSLDGAEILLGTRNIVEEYDVLIVRDFHPYVAEALTVAKFFSDAGKVVIDQILTEEGYSISKMHDYLVLAEAGLPVPLTYQLYKPLSLRAGLKKLGYPAVLKGDRGSHGEHVYRIKTPKQAKKIFEKYPSGGLLLQEYLPADGDYRVVTLGYKALPVLVKRYPAKNDFRTNFQLTRNWQALKVKNYPYLKNLAEKSARVMRREFSAIDIRFKDGQALILEVNRRPGFDGFEQATGLNVAALFLKYAAAKWRQRKK